MKKSVLLFTILSLVLIFPTLSNAQETERRSEECQVNELFYTVQLGVFSKQISAAAFPKEAGPVYYIKRADGKFLYFSGLFDCRFAAMRQRYNIAKSGNHDVYIASYYKREQINIVRADELIEEHGNEILYKPQTAKI